MIGILIQLVISWLLLWLLEKKNLAVLGLKPTKDRTIDFAFGILAAATCCLIYYLTTAFLSDNSWQFNSGFSFEKFVDSFWWVFKSVAFEELIFRGAVFYILIQRTGVKIACLISSVAFGVYHWFSFGVLGNPISMIYVFVLTGIWGLMYAVSFSKTKSLYLPFALHLGWNLFNIIVFSQGPLGSQLLLASDNGQKVEEIFSVVLLLFQVFALPIIVYLYLKAKAKKANQIVLMD